MANGKTKIKSKTKTGNGKNKVKGKAEACPINVKLLEGTALKYKDAKVGKNNCSVWIKKAHLEYEIELKRMQIELMKLQKHMRASGTRILAIFEGRDAAGKGGTIKRITAFLNPRLTKVVALDKPSDKEVTQWYFQRYVPHLPAASELVLFDRSWYNRAMVEPVMGFCTDEQHKRFLKDVPLFEEMLVKDGVKLFKFYFSVSKEEQAKRFDSRKTDPLKQYKLSPVDNLAQKYWDQYSVKKFQMLNESNRTISPWTIIRSDSKKRARINCMKHILTHLEYEDKLPGDELRPDPEIVISGIGEIQHMEKNLFSPKALRG
ncbi:MAG: polyphosphate kinase 2 [Thermodesulfobacteriota bacterium]|nr:polyphosphate kinase 2 [Thermodesulfobacteriota bacterium]